MSTVGKDKQYMLYDFGIHIPLIKNTVDVYIPLLMSQDIIKTFYLNNSDLVPVASTNSDPNPFKRTLRMIRFTFNIHKLNPFDFVRNIDL